MKLQVKLVKSMIGNVPRNRKTCIALGLRRVGQTVIHEDSPSIRGMLLNIRHLVDVKPAEDK